MVGGEPLFEILRVGVTLALHIVVAVCLFWCCKCVGPVSPRPAQARPGQARPCPIAADETNSRRDVTLRHVTPSRAEPSRVVTSPAKQRETSAKVTSVKTDQGSDLFKRPNSKRFNRHVRPTIFHLVFSFSFLYTLDCVHTDSFSRSRLYFLPSEAEQDYVFLRLIFRHGLPFNW